MLVNFSGDESWTNAEKHRGRYRRPKTFSFSVSKFSLNPNSESKGFLALANFGDNITTHEATSVAKNGSKQKMRD